MMTRRFDRAAGNAPEPATPAEQAEAVPDDLAAAADQMARDAEQARERTSPGDAGAQALMNVAEQEAAKITAARPLVSATLQRSPRDEGRRSGKEHGARLRRRAAHRSALSAEVDLITAAGRPDISHEDILGNPIRPATSPPP